MRFIISFKPLSHFFKIYNYLIFIKKNLTFEFQSYEFSQSHTEDIIFITKLKVDFCENKIATNQKLGIIHSLPSS